MTTVRVAPLNGSAAAFSRYRSISRHEHFNTSGDEPARLVSLTSQPVAFEMYRDPEFIFGTEHKFLDRFDPGDPDFFSQPAAT